MADTNDAQISGSPVQDVDPAAEFLAREQDELAGLDDDNFVGGDSVPTGDFTTQPSLTTTDGSLGSDYGGFEADQQDNEGQLNGPTDTYSSISQVDRLANEPEQIRLWREEQTTMLKTKDLDADKQETEWREIAKREISEWNSRQAEQLTKAKTSNRASEKVFIEERDEETPGQEWERIARLCDFNPKNSKNSKDVTRLRSILLHLKQSGMEK